MNKIITILLIFVSCLAFGQGATPNLRSGLYLYYKLQRTTGSVIDETNRNDGTNSGSTRGSTGKIDNCFSFDGSNDYVDTGIDSEIYYGNNDVFSVSFWISHNFSATTGFDRIIAKGGTASTSVQELFIQQNGTGNTVYGYIVSTPSDVAYTASTTTSLTASTWYHVVFYFDGTNTKIYLNSSNEGTSSDFTGSVNRRTSDKITIGASSTLQSITHYNGLLDEIMIYKRVLTDLEIDQLYNSSNGLLFVQENFKKNYNYEKLINYVISRQYFTCITGANEYTTGYYLVTN
jgi:hypothetical protein